VGEPGLIEVFVAAYRPYVLSRLEELGIAVPPGMTDSLDKGERWLGAALEEMLVRPYPEQRRGPLELFQEAASFPTEALIEAGIAPVDRDPVAVSALPGDLYDLAPASSQSLGEEAWKAHLTWGAAKAAALTSGAERGILVVSANLLDRSRIESAIKSSGLNVASSGDASVTRALVDLSAPGAIDRIKELAAHGVDVIAYGSHVDTATLEAATAAGATETLPRSVFFRRLGVIVSG
jgi:hypothetical protein